MSQKSEIVHYFLLQISVVHTFFVTSQLLKQEKRAVFFQPKAIAKGLLILDNCETKKCFIVLHNNIVVLTKRKKTSDLVCLFFAFFILEEKTNLKKTKTKQRCFVFKGKCSLFCFLAMGKLCLKQNEQSFVI